MAEGTIVSAIIVDDKLYDVEAIRKLKAELAMVSIERDNYVKTCRDLQKEVRENKFNQGNYERLQNAIFDVIEQFVEEKIDGRLS